MVVWLTVKTPGEAPSVHVAITDFASGSSAWITTNRGEGVEAEFDPAYSRSGVRLEVLERQIKASAAAHLVSAPIHRNLEVVAGGTAALLFVIPG